MMEYGFFCNDLDYVIDPLGVFKSIDPKALCAECGLIPSFIDPEADDVVETALANYGFNIGGPMTGGVVEKDGTYKYPEDPDMHPIAKCANAKDKTIFIYSYGIIAFVDNNDGTNVVYRFD